MAALRRSSYLTVPTQNGWLHRHSRLQAGVLLAYYLGVSGSIPVWNCYNVRYNPGIYGYLAQLRAGIREVTNISDAFASKCGEFLGWPRMQVLMAAGKVKPADLYAA